MAKKIKNPPDKEETIAIIKRVLAENASQYKMQYFYAFVLLAIASAAQAYPAYLIGKVVNQVFKDQDLAAAKWIALVVVAVFTIRGFATYGHTVILGRIANNIVARYQRNVYKHLLQMGVEYFKDTRSSYLVSQVNQNIGGMRTMLNDIIVVFARDFLTLIALTGVMIYQDPVMSLTSLLILPILFFAISRYVKRIRKIARSQINLNAKVTSSIVETVQGIDIVKSFTMEGQMRDKVNKLTVDAEKRSNKIIQLNAKTKPPTEILAGIVIGGVIAFGGYRVIELGDDMGKLISFLAAAMLAYEPARKLASFRVSFEKTLVNARMLYKFLDTPPRQADKADASDFTFREGKIELQNVGFSYKSAGQLDNGDDMPRTIKGISMVAESGQTTALVGPSGGGKSTLISLIQRFYDLDEGQIRIDDQNISDVTELSLRHHISYVSQQPIMFEGSIRDNIKLGKPDATDEEIHEAAKQAQAHDFIVNLPDGYNTLVGELGGNLSGGQRQRISIARAIVRNAPILLLDEATSALDNESEKLVQIALDSIMHGRTTIVIAHRLSTIQHADKIVVINGGEVIEQGSHEELIKEEDGLYAKLYRIIGSQDASALADDETGEIQP